MTKPILVSLIAFVVLVLVVLWVIGGGPRRAFEGTAGALRGAIPSEDTEFRLPWQPAQLFPTIDLADSFDLTFEESESGYVSAQDRLIQLEAEYDRLNAEASNARTFGTPSPYINAVTIVQDASGLRESDPSSEYVQIAASYTNDSSIDISGWILESALSGTRVMIPPSASPYIANSANVLGPTALEPGGLALVASAPSPIGVSFRENLCTGYLGQFQTFSPPLAMTCPSPSQVLPLTTENLQRYGEACFDAAASISECQFPQNLTGVSGACSAYLSERLSYNGCVQQNQFRSSFQSNVWRVYLGAPGDLWRNSHDAIRLLDAQGRTVSVFVY